MELSSYINKKKANKLKETYSYRYQHCNRCTIALDIHQDEEIVCGLCGETFCGQCISKHQKYCYGIW